MKYIIPILLLIVFCIPAGAVGAVGNITTINFTESIMVNWDDEPTATNYSVYQYLPAMIFTNTAPVIDGSVDVVYNTGHTFVMMPPNPVTSTDYETIQIIRNANNVYIAAQTHDADSNARDDWVRVYVDFDNDGLTESIDRSYLITEDEDIEAYLWDGTQWDSTGTGAMCAVTGAGSNTPVYELSVPISEMPNFNNESSHTILLERSHDPSPGSRIYSFFPRDAVPTITTDWETFYLTTNATQRWSDRYNTLESNYEITGLDSYNWYRIGVSYWVSSTESDIETIDAITTTDSVYIISGNVYDENTGHPIRNAKIFMECLCGIKLQSVTTNNTGGFCFSGTWNDTFLIEAEKSGYTNSIQEITIAGENESIEMFLSTAGINKIPLVLFLVLGILDGCLIVFSFLKEDNQRGIFRIISSFLATTLTYALSKMIINGQVVESFEYPSVIESIMISTFAHYIAIIMGILTIILTVLYLQEHIRGDIQ